LGVDLDDVDARTATEIREAQKRLEAGQFIDWHQIFPRII
jgi:hypothetical protein